MLKETSDLVSVPPPSTTAVKPLPVNKDKAPKEASKEKGKSSKGGEGNSSRSGKGGENGAVGSVGAGADVWRRASKSENTEKK